MQRVDSGAINLNHGDAQGVKSPTDVGSAKAKDEKAPLSEIIEVLNERFGTEFSKEDRLFFEQIKEKAVKNPKMIDTALSNPLDKFQLGIKKMIADLMIERMLAVDCSPSGAAVYLKSGNSEEFFIRAGASTEPLQPSEMAVHIRQRF